MGAYGNKKQGLDRLVERASAYGYQVPPFEAIDTDGHEEFLRFKEDAGRVLGNGDTWAIEQRACAMFAESRTAARARDAVSRLGLPVILRSDGTCEDGANSPYAGAFASELLRADSRDDRLCEQLTCVYRSYDTAKEFNAVYQVPDDARLGVIVQRWIPSTVAGVLFTQLPENPGRVCIELAAGYPWIVQHGDSSTLVELEDGKVVDLYHGFAQHPVRMHVDGELYDMERASGGEIDQLVSLDALRRRKSEELARLWNERTYPVLGRRCPLPLPELERLARIGKGLERDFGVPLDIEFVYDHDQLYLVQARPVTNINHEPFEPLPHVKDPLYFTPIVLNRGVVTGPIVFFEKYAEDGFPPMFRDLTRKVCAELYRRFPQGFILAQEDRVQRSVTDAPEESDAIDRKHVKALLDTESGTRLGHHDINTRYLGMPYLGCPGLTDKLIPYLSGRITEHVWFSDVEFTVASNGLRGFVAR